MDNFELNLIEFYREEQIKFEKLRNPYTHHNNQKVNFPGHQTTIQYTIRVLNLKLLIVKNSFNPFINPSVAHKHHRKPM